MIFLEILDSCITLEIIVLMLVNVFCIFQNILMFIFYFLILLKNNVTTSLINLKLDVINTVVSPTRAPFDDINDAVFILSLVTERKTKQISKNPKPFRKYLYITNICYYLLFSLMYFFN